LSEPGTSSKMAMQRVSFEVAAANDSRGRPAEQLTP